MQNRRKMQGFGVYIKDWLSLRFIRRRRGSMDTANPTMQESQDLPQWSIYLSDEDCPMSAFIPALVNQDPSHLIVSGKPPTQALNDAFLTIYSAYCQWVGGVQIAALLKQSGAVNALASKIERVATLLEIASTMACAEICAELAIEGYTVDPDADDDEYMRQVSVAKSRSKGDILRLEQMLSEKPKAKNGAQKETKEMFLSNFIQIEEMMHREVNPETTTVAKYGAYVQALKKKIKDSLPKQVQQHGSGRKAQ